MRSLSLVSLLLVGCGRAPVEAPESLNELALFLVRNAEGDTLAELDAGLVELESELVAIGFDGSTNDRSVTLTALGEADLGGLPTHDGFDPDAQVPVGVVGRSTHDMDAQLRIVEETNHVCIESATTKFYGREFTSDVACFVDRSCDTLSTVNEVRKESILANVWYDLHKDYRWVPMEDGREAMIARSWLAEPFQTDGGGGSWDQTYVFEAWIPDDSGGVQRWYAMWSSVSLSAINDGAWAALVKDGIDEGYEFADDYLADFADEACRNDRDREYDREQ